MLPVLIYADSWPFAYALEALCRYQYPERPVQRCDSLSMLSNLLQVRPSAPLILFGAAHEQIFLLYAIRPLLDKRRVLVISDNIYYSDRVLLEYHGVSSIMAIGSLLPLLSSPPQVEHSLKVFLQDNVDTQLMEATPVPIWGDADEEDEVLLLIASLMKYRLTLSSLKAKEVKVLWGLWAGVPMITLSQQMGVTYGMVSSYKISALRKLDIDNRPDSFIRSGPPHAFLQRTPFITPGDFIRLGVTPSPPLITATSVMYE